MRFNGFEHTRAISAYPGKTCKSVDICQSDSEQLEDFLHVWERGIGSQWRGPCKH